MNLSILFVFICIIALIIYTKHSKKPSKNTPTFIFAQKGGGRGGKGAGPKRGGGGRGGGPRGGGGPKGGPSGPSGPSGPGGPGGPSGGLPVKNIDELNTIFNIIGFKFKSGGNIGQAPPQFSNTVPGRVGGPPDNKLPGLPPMPGSNNNNIDEILKQMMQK